MSPETRIDPTALPTNPDELRELARSMAERLQRIDDAATAAAEPLVSVRWIRDAIEGMGQINGRTYAGKGPIYTRRHTPTGEVTELLRPGEVQQLPLGAATVLQAAGYVEGVTGEDAGHIYAAMTGASA